ncbi:MAG TPA: GEVED domain-containing protein, partial [Vicinamibacterales bacterium]|nr:GEVED domain-containing protein [Vicinamibacterales bacterium]
WSGSDTPPIGSFVGGETEDYPIRVEPPTGDNCPDYEDWGDAPEEFLAYPGVIGHFPTCSFATGPGTQEVDCAPISTAPGQTGYVRHVYNGNSPAVWLGCAPVPPGSIDSETDGKSNDTGGAMSMCANIPVDCVENAFGMSFGQDECFGDADAGVTGPVTFTACDTTKVKLDLFNCSTQTVIAYLNVLVDWNQDGDWNDNFLCRGGANPVCAYEWPVKNLQIGLPPGCTTLETPAILAGPFAGAGWMRVTLTLGVVSDDFPWSGSDTPPIGSFVGGETEDYPVTIAPPDPCEVGYEDFGDAPEGFRAYGLTTGRFPTCLTAGPIGTQEIECDVPLSTPPGPAGYVRHLQAPGAPDAFWLGCGSAADPGLGVDSEVDGKSSLGLAASSCNPAVTVDCIEAFGLPFGQDECYGDLDAGLGDRVAFGACSTQALTFTAYSCATVDQQVFLNVLVDWNQDGDWNDNAICRGNKRCAPEWAVKNVVVDLIPGCGTYTSPMIQVADSTGIAWMRITLTREPVLDDFPWNGSGSEPNAYYVGGETEDYGVAITPSTVDVATGAMPDRVWLAPLTPNPSRMLSTIRFGLPHESDVRLEAFDVNGRRVRTFVDRHMPAGRHTLQWDFRDDAGRVLPSGIYLVKLRVGSELLTSRVIRIR